MKLTTIFLAAMLTACSAAPSTTPFAQPTAQVTNAPGSSGVIDGVADGTLDLGTTVSAITVSGPIDRMFKGGFTVQGGKGVGNLHVYVNSSTTVYGTPALNAQVKATGTGSYSTSLTATTVSVNGATATPSPTPAPTATPTPVPTPTIAPTPTPVPTTTPSGTLLWQVGDSYVDSNTGDCGTPAITGTSIYFDLVKNPGCMRNQINPVGNGGSGTYALNVGQTYTWSFQTVTHMGIDTGKYTQRLIWQIHQYVCGDSPITVLGIENMSGTPTGQVWYFSSGFGTVTMPYTEGATDTWQITANISDTSSGSITLYRNGAKVAGGSGPTFTCGATPFWNFGPYMWDWTNGNAVSSLTNVAIQFNYMQLSQ